jgi:glyoxylase I family protein
VERVEGIGGFFFKGDDVDGLTRWYAEHLGIAAPPATEEDDDQTWVQQSGPTVFAPFGADQWDSPHLGPSGWGINFRVRDLDAMVAQLRTAGIAVEVDPVAYPYGRFASLHDPEGNPVQLWQEA